MARTQRARRQPPKDQVLAAALLQARQSVEQSAGSNGNGATTDINGRKLVPKGTYRDRADATYVQATAQVEDYLPRIIDALLWDRRVTQQELADDMGLSVHALRDRLKGRTKLSAAEVVGIAQLLNVDVMALLDPTYPLAKAVGSQTGPDSTTQRGKGPIISCFTPSGGRRKVTQRTNAPGQGAYPGGNASQLGHDAPASGRVQPQSAQGGWLAGMALGQRKAR